jgi:hypothetical protein
MAPLSSPKKLTICACYSRERHKELSNFIEVIAAEPNVNLCDIVVATSSPSAQMRTVVDTSFQSHKVSTIIEINDPLSYSRLKIIATANVGTPYCAIIDDSVTVQPGWLEALLTFIDTSPPFEVAGTFHPTNCNDFKMPPYEHARSKRPWAKGIEQFPDINQALHQECLLLKTSFIYKYGYPDYAMQGLYDEPLLADLLSATQTKALSFDDNVNRHISYGTMIDKHNDIADLARPQTGVSDATLPFVGPLFSTCITTYGDYQKLIEDCLSSAIEDTSPQRTTPIIVGCNQSSRSIQENLNDTFAKQLIGGFIRSHKNIDKSGMQRYMYRMVETPYALSVDDDTCFHSGWIRSINQLITEHHPIALSGFVHEFTDRNCNNGKSPSYMDLVTSKHWWRNARPLENKVVFPSGSCFLVRMNLVRYFDFPNLGMEATFEDVLLGDLVLQAGGKIVNFSKDVQDKITTNRAPSRGIRTTIAI